MEKAIVNATVSIAHDGNFKQASAGSIILAIAVSPTHPSPSDAKVIPYCVTSKFSFTPLNLGHPGRSNFLLSQIQRQMRGCSFLDELL